jgi:hypothetical protein
MISAETRPGFAAFTARLTAIARTLGEAQAEQAALARRGDPVRWRKAALLWPLFTKG